MLSHLLTATRSRVWFLSGTPGPFGVQVPRCLCPSFLPQSKKHASRVNSIPLLVGVYIHIYSKHILRECLSCWRVKASQVTPFYNMRRDTRWFTIWLLTDHLCFKTNQIYRLFILYISFTSRRYLSQVQEPDPPLAEPRRHGESAWWWAEMEKMFFIKVAISLLISLIFSPVTTVTKLTLC